MIMMNTRYRFRYACITVILVLCSGVFAAGMVTSKGAVKISDVRLTPAWTIAFQRGDEIWTAHGNGTGQKRVIKNGMNPCWSPDKRLISFERNDNVWIANADGTHQRRLTSHRAGLSHAHTNTYNHSWNGIHMTWNRKYNLISFSHPEDLTLVLPGNRRQSSIKSSSIYDVWPSQPKIRWDYPSDNDESFFLGNVYARITPFTTDSGFVFSSYEHPAWSHDGEYLAFVCNGDIWIAHNVPDELPNNAGYHIWRWDSGRLAAVADYDATNDHVSRMNLGVTRISWSPDDRFLTYSISRLGGSGWDEVHLLSMSLGTDPWKTDSDTNLDDGSRQSGSSCFSPDGKSIAYSNYATGESTSIWVMSIADRKRSALILDADYPVW